MIQRTFRECSWSTANQAASGCTDGTACGTGGNSVASYCCCEDCTDDNLNCDTTYDTQVVEIATDSADWVQVAGISGHFTQEVEVTLGPYTKVNECCMGASGVDIAEGCATGNCEGVWDCDQTPPGHPAWGPVEGGVLGDYSTAKVNMDEDGLPLTVRFRLTLETNRVECFIEEVRGPTGFDYDGSYSADETLWLEQSGTSKGVILPILWDAGQFRCYCEDTQNVVGETITWDDPIQVGFTPVNGVDYTDGDGWGSREPFYLTRYLRCYVSGSHYEGRCGNCGVWADVRCWLGEVYAL